MLPAASVSPSRLRVFIVGGVLFFGTLLLFSRTLENGFIGFDDPGYVTENGHVQNGLNWEGLTWAFTTGTLCNWHPLTWLSHQLDVQFFGLKPAGHHATSVFWHGLNAVLVFLVFRRLTGSFWTSAFSAALFAWHPLRVESVAWVSERKDVLSAFFGLLTLLLYAHYVEITQGKSGGKRGLFYALSLLTFALGLMSKPMLVTLPFLLVLLDFWPWRRWQFERTASWLPILREKLPFFLLSLGACVATFLLQKGARVPVANLNLIERLANAVVSIPRYLGKFFWPEDLAVFYPHPTRWPGLAVALALALLIVVTALACAQRQRRPWLLSGWFWFLGMLVPVIGIVQVGLQSMADRYSYLPILGWQFALLWTLRPLVQRSDLRLWFVVGAGLILGGCAVRTWQQIGFWKDSYRLFERSLTLTRNNPVALNGLGYALLGDGQAAKAVPLLQEACALSPRFAEAHSNLGVALGQAGRLEEARASFQAALAIDPDRIGARVNLGYLCRTTGRLDEAVEHYSAALRLNPHHAEALNNLGKIRLDAGEIDEATRLFEAAVHSRPYYVAAVSNLGIVYLNSGRIDEAVARFRQAITIDPAYAPAYSNLGNALAEKRDWLAALAAYDEALRLDPASAVARQNREQVRRILKK